MNAVRMQFNLFPSIPGLYYVNEAHIRFMSCWYYDNAVLPTYLMSPHCVLVQTHPRYDFFEHVHNSPTSAKTIKIASLSYQLRLCSFYVMQVRTASDQIYINVVETCSSVTGFN